MLIYMFMYMYMYFHDNYEAKCVVKRLPNQITAVSSCLFAVKNIGAQTVTVVK